MLIKFEYKSEVPQFWIEKTYLTWMIVDIVQHQTNYITSRALERNHQHKFTNHPPTFHISNSCNSGSKYRGKCQLGFHLFEGWHIRVSSRALTKTVGGDIDQIDLMIWGSEWFLFNKRKTNFTNLSQWNKLFNQNWSF